MGNEVASTGNGVRGGEVPGGVTVETGEGAPVESGGEALWIVEEITALGISVGASGIGARNRLHAKRMSTDATGKIWRGDMT